ncbi:MAG: glycosyltransferase family 2 protein [Burkholderiaceae bacterium]|nr:glycosyltransferase family 2 protein [Burkholderiaceae bacterium]
MLAKEKKNTLSVILITKNEEANILECLTSISFADQVIVVDNGSTDNTVAIARTAGASVLQTEDWPGFGAQKNRALALATCDWVLSIDADERVSVQLADQIQVVMRGPKAAAYHIPRLTQFCGQWIRHCGWTPDYVLRLFKRESARFSDDLVHERLIQIQGTSEKLTAPILHYSYPTPAQYWRKLDQYSQAWAQQRYTEGRKVSMFRAGVSGLSAFVRSYFFRLGFLDGAMGFAVCTMQAQAAFGKYFSLYCLNQNNERPKNQFFS